MWHLQRLCSTAPDLPTDEAKMPCIWVSEAVFNIWSPRICNCRTSNVTLKKNLKEIRVHRQFPISLLKSQTNKQLCMHHRDTTKSLYEYNIIVLRAWLRFCLRWWYTLKTLIAFLRDLRIMIMPVMFYYWSFGVWYAWKRVPSPSPLSFLFSFL